jgi:hypothetical protein
MTISNNNFIIPLLRKVAADNQACWDGYKQVGKKTKNGKQVPNCVPVDKQATIKQAKNKPTNPELWSRAKAKAKAKFDVYPSAYANGWASKWYKEQGGGWESGSDDNSKKSDLREWFKEDWVDISKKDKSGKHPPCGRSDADDKTGYPKCRPSKRVSEDTPETTRSMSKEEKRKAVAQKRRAEAKPRKGKKPHMTSHNKESSSFASNSVVNAPIRCTPGFGCKRYLTPMEREEIAIAKAQMFPTLFPMNADPISSQLSSPAWAGIGTGLIGALLGAGVGGGVGAVLEKSMPMAALLGGATGGLGGLLYGFSSRARKNKEIEALIGDLPVGADLGDIEVLGDPKVKAQLARDFQRQLWQSNFQAKKEI